MAAHQQGGNALEFSEARLPSGKDLAKDWNRNRRLSTALYLMNYEPEAGNRNLVEKGAYDFLENSTEYQQIETKIMDAIDKLCDKYGFPVSANSLKSAFPEVSEEEMAEILQLLREKKSLKQILLRRGRLRYLSEPKLGIKASLTAEIRAKGIDRFGKLLGVIAPIPSIVG
ncbi:uncharacterized protein DFL_002284 [Arthrobotrys flagrans]|uniref:Uncharacterized protein n=1 Tax=Arthrobotrys flagrans TaxID=97331 RepID=A0A437AA91_ARTFL|nr:hypothetical protein DFL_002284 [Arthrobotrys flagrans]